MSQPSPNPPAPTTEGLFNDVRVAVGKLKLSIEALVDYRRKDRKGLTRKHADLDGSSTDLGRLEQSYTTAVARLTEGPMEHTNSEEYRSLLRRYLTYLKDDFVKNVPVHLGTQSEQQAPSSQRRSKHRDHDEGLKNKISEDMHRLSKAVDKCLGDLFCELPHAPGEEGRASASQRAHADDPDKHRTGAEQMHSYSTLASSASLPDLLPRLPSCQNTVFATQGGSLSTAANPQHTWDELLTQIKADLNAYESMVTTLPRLASTFGPDVPPSRTSSGHHA